MALLIVYGHGLRSPVAVVALAVVATFGERVEDFFLITDQSNRPLDVPAQEELREALARCVNVAASASPEGMYVIA